jgi:phosphate-selective porin OprO and OprP
MSQNRHSSNQSAMQYHKSISRTLLATSLMSCLTLSAQADPSGLFVGKLTGESDFDKAWSAYTLYKDEDNAVLQEFSLQGRLQLQSFYGESDDGSFNTSDQKAANDAKELNNDGIWGNDIEVRRARVGFKSKWFNNWKFDGQINVDTDGHDKDGDNTFYKDIYDLYVTYAPSDALNISAGKTKVKFSREQEISSKEILTIERSLVSNLLFPGELTGLWANGKGIGGHWLYEAGVYGNDRVREFSEFNGGAIMLGKVGYDYASLVGLDSAVASFQYMHNTSPTLEKEETDSFTGSSTPIFSDSIALTNDIVQGRFGLTTDVLYGFGDSVQSDVFGVSVIPSYFIADGLQLVGRFQFASSNGGDGLKLPSRYEGVSGSADSVGNTYTSVYAGLNYYIYGHKLKLMTGLEYAHLGGGEYDGYTLQGGLRYSF